MSLDKTTAATYIPVVSAAYICTQEEWPVESPEFRIGDGQFPGKGSKVWLLTIRAIDHSFKDLSCHLEISAENATA